MLFHFLQNIYASPPPFHAYIWQERGTGHGNGLDLDGNGDGITGVCRRQRHHGRRECGRLRGGRGSGGAMHRHGGGAVSVERRYGAYEPLRSEPEAGSGPASCPGAAAAPGQPGPGDSGGSVGQRVRQSAGPGQCRHTTGHPGGPAHGKGAERRGRRRAVPPGGAEHGIPAAAAHHGSRSPGRLRVPDALRHPAGGVAVVGHLRDGGTADGPAAEPGMEELTWTPRHS